MLAYLSYNLILCLTQVLSNFNWGFWKYKEWVYLIFSRNCTDVQQKYTVAELELLSISETLKAFKLIFWGQKILIYIDHKNLVPIAIRLAINCAMQSQLLLKTGTCNIIYQKSL